QPAHPVAASGRTLFHFKIDIGDGPAGSGIEVLRVFPGGNSEPPGSDGTRIVPRAAIAREVRPHAVGSRRYAVERERFRSMRQDGFEDDRPALNHLHHERALRTLRKKRVRDGDRSRYRSEIVRVRRLEMEV